MAVGAHNRLVWIGDMSQEQPQRPVMAPNLLSLRIFSNAKGQNVRQAIPR